MNYVRSQHRSIFVAGFALTLAAACSPKSSTTVPPGPAGGPVMGAADTHCTGDAGVMVQAVNPASCHADAGTPMPDDAGVIPSPYGDTMFNAEGDDDDCKYHMKWTSSGIYKNYDITFTATVTNKAKNAPETGANPRLEIFLNDKHPAPNSPQKATETSPGVYSIGPVQLDASGQWTVRFHFHEECNDLPDAAHGHAAFYVNVP